MIKLIITYRLDHKHSADFRLLTMLTRSRNQKNNEEVFGHWSGVICRYQLKICRSHVLSLFPYFYENTTIDNWNFTELM